LSSHSVAVYTLGCKVNQNESYAIINLFKKAGYREVPFDHQADVYVINSCTVTHLADRKSRQMIRRAVKANPDAIVVVTGCYAQTAPGEVADIPGVDVVVGTRDRARLVDLVEQVKETQRPVRVVTDIKDAEVFEEISWETEQSHRVRAYLKIQEGCNRFCSYCIVPYARGPVRSRPVGQVIQAARDLVGLGYKEIVLTGIHTGAYGMESSEGVDLSTLIEKLLCIQGLHRLRISSIEPNEINDRLLGLMAEVPSLCRHLHVPLQSGDDAVLQRMNRVYRAEDYRNLVRKMRKKIPGLAVTTDVIVGFPGETDEAFSHTYHFVEEIKFSSLHVFKYSPRKGTPAADFSDQVAAVIKEKRSKELISLGKRLSEEYAKKNVGHTLEVLVEKQVPVGGQDYWEGHTDNYLTVKFPSDQSLKGQLINVRLDKYKDGAVFGHLVGITDINR